MCVKKVIMSSKDLKQEFKGIFSSCQLTTAAHQLKSITLKKLYDESHHEEFWSHLKRILTILLRQKLGNPYVEKTISFIGIFCSLLTPTVPAEADENDTNDSLEIKEHILLNDILFFLLQASEVREDIVRIRSCEIINVILEHLIGVDISPTLFENLENTLSVRLSDPKLHVRYQAVLILHRLQDPLDLNDNVVGNLIDLMSTDRYAKVRCICLEKIAPRKDVTSHILMRIRDVDKNVRLAAFKRLAKLPRNLRISERQQVLHTGFTDESEDVRNYVSSTFIKSWLEFYDCDILKFMKSLRLDADQRDIDNTVNLFEKLLYAIFEINEPITLSATLKLDEKRLVSFDKLDWETASFWRIFVQFLSDRPHLEGEVDRVIPELVSFCEYIKEFYMNLPMEKTADEFLEQQFILKQLFLITKTYDFGDVFNRNCLNKLVAHILETYVLVSDVVENIIGVLDCSIPDVDERIMFICEMFSDILYPIKYEKPDKDHEFEIARMAVEINKYQDLKEEAIRNENFREAGIMKGKIEELQKQLENEREAKAISEQPQKSEKSTDIVTIIKCLDIVAGTLLSPKIERLTPPLKVWREDFVQNLLLHERTVIRFKAFRCYGLFATIDKETAAVGIHLFSAPIFEYAKGEELDVNTILVCIGAVVDILRIYGPELVAVPENGELSESMEERQQAVFTGGTCLTAVLQDLCALMNDDLPEIQERAVLGLCQLVLSNRIISATLLSRIILKWCNPITEDESNSIKHIIGYMLEKVPLLDCADQLIDATFITINALYEAPAISPLADVNLENVAKFLLALCKTSKRGKYIHSTIALRMLNDMIEKPRNELNKVFSKLLLILDIPDDQISIVELMDQCCNLNDSNRDRRVINNVRKMITKLNLKLLDPSDTRNEDGPQNKTTADTILEENEDAHINIIKDASNVTLRRRTVNSYKCDTEESDDESDFTCSDGIDADDD